MVVVNTTCLATTVSALISFMQQKMAQPENSGPSAKKMKLASSSGSTSDPHIPSVSVCVSVSFITVDYK